MSNTGSICRDSGPMELILGATEFSDYCVHTCKAFAGSTNPFLYIWMYIGETIGPLHIHVISNFSCWPQMAPQIMSMGSDGNIEYCSPRAENTFLINDYTVCPHICRCRNCGNYIVVQLPVIADTFKESKAICEILLQWVNLFCMVLSIWTFVDVYLNFNVATYIEKGKRQEWWNTYQVTMFYFNVKRQSQWFSIAKYRLTPNLPWVQRFLWPP